MSPEHAVRTRAPRRRTTLVMVCLGAALGGLIFGYDTSVLNSSESAISTYFSLSAGMRGVMTSVSLLGCALGASVAGSLSERFGRIRVMRAVALLYCAAVLVAGLAPTIHLLLVGRTFTGVAIGAASVMVPAYIAEIAPARSRGKLGSLQQLLITVGILVALLVGLEVARRAGGSADVWWFGLEAWRWIVLSAVVPGALYGFASLRLPESPRYLVAHGREENAVAVFAWVSGVDEATARTTVAEIRSSLGHEPSSSLRTLRGNALGLMPIVWAGIGVAVFIQASGINAVFVYSSSLWRSVGFSESGALTV
ncbi:MAG: MFS transporter, partial [Cellulomonadaceae bacterium]